MRTTLLHNVEYSTLPWLISSLKFHKTQNGVADGSVGVNPNIEQIFCSIRRRFNPILIIVASVNSHGNISASTILTMSLVGEQPSSAASSVVAEHCFFDDFFIILRAIRLPFFRANDYHRHQCLLSNYRSSTPLSINLSNDCYYY
jgi:hypothetical protein